MFRKANANTQSHNLHCMMMQGASNTICRNFRYNKIRLKCFWPTICADHFYMDKLSKDISYRDQLNCLYCFDDL